MRFVKFWAAESILVFLAYVVLNALSDVLAAAIKVHDAISLLPPVAIGMGLAAHLVVWPILPFAHPYSQDRVVTADCLCNFAGN